MPAKTSRKKQSEESPLLGINEELQVTSGRLLETAGVMHSFAQALQTSGFREYVDYMGRPWRTFWWNLLMGIGRGLGFVIGATVIVAIVVWIISGILANIPIVGDFFRTLGEFLAPENIEHLQSQDFTQSFAEMLDAFKANVLETQSKLNQP